MQEVESFDLCLIWKFNIPTRTILGDDLLPKPGTCVGDKEETKVLRRLQTAGPGGTPLPNVLDLYDAFVIRGLNGFHNCLVTELVFPCDVCHMGKKYRLGAVLERVAVGFAQIHQAAIAHGGRYHPQ